MSDIKKQIIKAITENFTTFGGGQTSEWNPVVNNLSDKEPMFALGVSVGKVVDFILERMSKWKPCKTRKDYPKVEGDYLVYVQRKEYPDIFRYEVFRFDGKRWNSEMLLGWKVIGWKEIEPFSDVNSEGK